MTIAALVETKKVNVAKNHNVLDNTHAFTIVGLHKLFYDQKPDTMTSLGAAAYLSIVGVGSFVSNGIIYLLAF